MSSVDVGHPGEEQLVRYAVGELAGGELDEVRRHVEICRECRAEFAEWERSFRACVSYREEVLAAHLPPPPASWCDLRAQMDEADISTISRWQRWLGFGSLRRWTPAMATVVLAGVVAYRMYDAPSARAAELLLKAVVAESRAPKARRIQIRTRALRVTRMVGSVLPAADAASMASVEALFRSANYNWDDPLSAKSFVQWRDRLSDARDEVSNGGDAYRIRTTSGSSEIASATLQLRAEDLHPTESTLEFRNHEKVEITELPDTSAPVAPSSAGRPDVPAKQPEAVPNTPVEAPRATPSDELHVFAALRRLDADLGEPVEVTRTAYEVLVTGTGLDSQRALEIQRALSALPRVVVRFSDPSAVAAVTQGGTAARTSTANPAVARLQAKLEVVVGGRAAFEQWSEQVLERTESLMARAHALRRLSQQFGPEVEALLRTEDQALLLGLRNELGQSLLGQEAAMQRLMAPAFRASPNAPASAGGSWQVAAENLFQSAWRVDRLVGLVFGSAVAEPSQELLEPQFARRLTEMRAAAEAYKTQ